MRVALVNCATTRELGRGNIEGQMAPLDVLYLKRWLEICRVNTELEFIDEKRLTTAGREILEFGDRWDIVIYWIRPATLRRSIESASRSRAHPDPYLIAIGPGAYGWESRYSDHGPFDLVVEGGPYGVIEKVLRGDVIRGTVTGDSFMPPVQLPLEATHYPVGRLTTSWGMAGPTTYSVLPKMQMFNFRNTVRIRAEIDMLMASEIVQYIEVADRALFMHPGTREIMAGFGGRKEWGAVLDCRRKHGEIVRVRDGIEQGLRILRLDVLTRDNDILRSISKRSSRREIARTFAKVLLLRKEGLQIIVRLLYGLPHQTWEGILEDIGFFERNQVFLQLDPLIVHPGTWLWYHRKRCGLVLDDDNLVAETRTMSQVEIKNLRLMAEVMNKRLNDVGPRVLMQSC